MRDLRHKLDRTWMTASRLTPQSGGRCVMFISAREGEGTSSVAASFALMAARKSQKSTWLIDLDLRRNAMFAAFENGFVRDAGEPGRAFDASLKTDPIYTLTPPGVDRGSPNAANKLFTVHEIKKTRLLVSRFRNEEMRAGQRVQLRTQPEWWRTVRRAADWVVVDAPALSRSPAGLAMAAQMDGVIIVMEADSTGAEELIGLRREIETHGGTVVGIVMNRMGADARFADRLAG
ncbi:hypothetical protein WNY37_14680 [Henriciella sp. AS95]|uniref:hypothetical protein n=1 Tax=Henriciella sp. AS95 TaxID=3135782 RepID=UPI003177917F